MSGISAAGGHLVLHEAGAQRLLAVVVDDLLEQRAGDALGDAASALALHDLRVDRNAAVLHAHIAQDLNAAGAPVQLHHHAVVALENVPSPITSKRPRGAQAPARRPWQQVRLRYATSATFSNATHGVVVELDAGTGALRSCAMCAWRTAALRSTRRSWRANAEGGIAQGIAGALFEQVVYDDSGQPLCPSFMEYKVPTAARSRTCHLPPGNAVRVHRERAKGAGEGGTIAPRPPC